MDGENSGNFLNCGILNSLHLTEISCKIQDLNAGPLWLVLVVV
jgi:hypothetical protein